jgi:predicted DNA-binding transcriptional regulator AlpA
MHRNDRPTSPETPAEDSTARDGRRPPRRASRWLKAGLKQPKDQNRGKAPGISSGDSSGRGVGAISPSIASLVANPSTASDIPMHQIPTLVAELASEQATLSALQGLLTTRLLASRENSAAPSESADHLLTAEQVAIILGVTKRWVERRARRLPFARRLSAHAVRYSESGLKRWMANRQMRTA